MMILALAFKIYLSFLAPHQAMALSPELCTLNPERGEKNCLEEVYAATKNAGNSPTAPCSNLTYDEAMARKISIDNSIEKPLENTPLPQLTEKFKKESPECLKFISAEPEKDGPYGPYGKEVISYLNEKGEDSLFLQDDPSAMKNVCPLWGKLSQEKRKHLWVWFMASIAFDESRCIKSASNNEATNGVAIGLFQLDERPSMRSWRGQNCRTVTVKEPIDNIRCTMDIFEELLKGPKGTYKSNGELWGRGSNSYFQKLRRDQGGQIGTLFKSNPICSSQ